MGKQPEAAIRIILKIKKLVLGPESARKRKR